MIKKIISVTLLVFSSLLLPAQYAIQPLTMGAGVIQKNQLWNVLLVNSSNTPISCRIDLIIREKISGLEQITASTSTFSLPKGAKQINSQLIGTVRYNYFNQISPRLSDELLPVGNYMACYRLYSGDVVKSNLLAEECVQFDVEPITEPILVQPTDSSQLAEIPKQFSWIPPTPTTLFNQLRYDITITEIPEGQKAKEAIENNTPVYTELNLLSNQLTTSQLSETLKKDKWYAWQVTAKDDKNYSRKTEVWVFKIKDSARITQPDISSYFLLEDNSNYSRLLTIKKDQLLIKYYSFLSEYSAKIQVTTVADSKTLFETNERIVYGDNFLKIKLPFEVQKGILYVLSFKDKMGITHSLKFIQQ